MATRQQSIQKHLTVLDHLEDISRKLVSPFGAALTPDEAVMLTELRHTTRAMTHLRALDQFFANSRMIG